MSKKSAMTMKDKGRLSRAAARFANRLGAPPSWTVRVYSHDDVIAHRMFGYMRGYLAGAAAAKRKARAST